MCSSAKILLYLVLQTLVPLLSGAFALPGRLSSIVGKILPTFCRSRSTFFILFYLIYHLDSSPNCCLFLWVNFNLLHHFSSLSIRHGQFSIFSLLREFCQPEEDDRAKLWLRALKCELLKSFQYHAQYYLHKKSLKKHFGWYCFDLSSTETCSQYYSSNQSPTDWLEKMALDYLFFKCSLITESKLNFALNAAIGHKVKFFKANGLTEEDKFL